MEIPWRNRYHAFSSVNCSNPFALNYFNNITNGRLVVDCFLFCPDLIFKLRFNEELEIDGFMFRVLTLRFYLVLVVGMECQPDDVLLGADELDSHIQREEGEEEFNVAVVVAKHRLFEFRIFSFWSPRPEIYIIIYFSLEYVQ